MNKRPATNPVDARTPASRLISERFPDARGMWEMESPRDFPSGFTLTLYQVNGGLVLVQQFHGGHGWDAYVQASMSGRIADTLDAIDTATKRLRAALHPAAEVGARAWPKFGEDWR